MLAAPLGGGGDINLSPTDGARASFIRRSACGASVNRDPSPVRAEILRDISREEVTRLTSELVKIPTVNPPGEERRICEFIASWLEKRGVAAELLEEVEGRTNVQAVVQGELPGGRTLVLNGHTDVVPVGNGWTKDPFGGRVEKGRVYGRGAADMKGGVASTMVAAAALHRHRKSLRGRLVLQAVADEEVGGQIGTGYLVRRGLRGDLAIVAEPTGLEVCVSHKGVVRFEVTTLGKSAHSSVPWEGRSAVLDMNVIVDALRAYGERLAKGRKHPLLGAPTVNVGVIQGGVAVNFVPDKCRIVAERRVVPPETVEEASRQVQKVVEDAAKKAGARYEMRFNSRSKTSDAGGEKAKVGVVLKAASEVIGRPAKAKGFLATCDARFLSNDAKIPSLVFGPGSLPKVHAPDEYVETKELEQAARVFALSFMYLQRVRPENEI